MSKTVFSEGVLEYKDTKLTNSSCFKRILLTFSKRWVKQWSFHSRRRFFFSSFQTPGRRCSTSSCWKTSPSLQLYFFPLYWRWTSGGQEFLMTIFLVGNFRKLSLSTYVYISSIVHRSSLTLNKCTYMWGCLWTPYIVGKCLALLNCTSALWLMRNAGNPSQGWDFRHSCAFEYGEGGLTWPLTNPK